ncbi:MAG: FAD-binding oxidoreductase [Thermogutta sp.]
MSSDVILETVFPASMSEAAEIVADAARERRAVYFRGAGTHFQYGCPPGRAGIAIATGAIQEVADYSYRDLTITVGCGVSLNRLGELLAQQSQFLPVDCVFGGDGTIGGAVAWSPPGPRAYRWGALQDYVLGVRAVDGMGRTFFAGGKVVKNAAGYNVTRLLTGSWGTLALILELTLMVRPLPEQLRLLSWVVTKRDRLERLLSCLIASRSEPSAIEVLGGPRWEKDRFLRVGDHHDECRVVAVYEGSAGEVDALCDELRRELSEAGLKIEEELPASSYASLSNFLADVARSSCVYELSVRPTRLAAALDQLRNLRPRASFLGHAGLGRIFAFADEDGDVTPESMVRLRGAIATLGGRVTVLRYPWDSSWNRTAIWGPGGTASRYMQGLKDQFDPHNILNPGRYVFPP